jgi:hypothetical protein
MGKVTMTHKMKQIEKKETEHSISRTFVALCGNRKSLDGSAMNWWWMNVDCPDCLAKMKKEKSQ